MIKTMKYLDGYGIERKAPLCYVWNEDKRPVNPEKRYVYLRLANGCITMPYVTKSGNDVYVTVWLHASEPIDFPESWTFGKYWDGDKEPADAEARYGYCRKEGGTWRHRRGYLWNYFRPMVPPATIEED